MLDQFRDITLSLQESSNINTLWASLIIEECYRLGLTYFCIAPGSRSTPLAIAATSHSFTNCIACFDERSVAFHAIGYAKGSHMPAVIITSSGTAVSNLLPAVVEASQDFLPLLLLTADRPPELLDTGANQAINQVNIFGTFVRHFVNLPVPTDNITARMVLTTLDSAVNHATSSPCGPVHINCPFREPLENTPKEWSQSCLKGLELWVSSGQPFTNYIQPHKSFTHDDVADVLGIIQVAKRGMLVIGAVFKEDDIWGALLLAKHLQWPVFADILSGLRLRKYKNSFSKVNEKSILFVDHLDHMLLSDEFRQWMNPDVILQIGSRITSKRVSQLLQDCTPCPYILIDNHCSRHDPSHIITHRIQGQIGQFTNCVVRFCTTNINHQWTSFLRSVNMMVEWEISFLIHSENSLSEPYVAQMTTEALDYASTMFIGNSMPIRDADMYGSSQGECGYSYGKITKLPSGFPFSWVQVAGNRGASGIDGLLSTAVGFSVGHNKRVVCVIGDVSFLHDTNGLALLKQRISRKQMTIVVINNHGGAIFSLLPIANKAEEKILNQYFYTSHDIGINNLCIAHGVKHVHVSTKLDLQNALLKSQYEDDDCVIEVESSIDSNKNFHSNLRQFACQAASHAFSTISHLSILNSIKVHKLEYFQYRIQLGAPLTSTPVGNENTTNYREGFVITLYLEDGNTGIGEVAPLGIHKGNLLEAQEQLQFLTNVIKGVSLNSSLPLLNESFSSWIWTHLGIPPDSLLPSVRCGLEMAILNAIASIGGSTMLNILHPSKQERAQKSLNITICALLDSNGTPPEVAYLAAKLVEEGFTAIKLKVARRENPIEDAEIIKEIRKKVGYHIQLRADANKKWSFDEAIQFGCNVKECGLQYIEEPVKNEDDIIKFCEETGLPVALDETIDNLQENPLGILARFTHDKIVAVVIKPSFVGGFEKAAFIARWAHHHGKMAVVSAAFESGISLSAYVQFSCFLEMKNKDFCKITNKENPSSVAHGLGTYKWLKEDVITESLRVRRSQASVFDAGQTLTNFDINQNSVIKSFEDEKVRNYILNVDVEGITFSINVRELGDKRNDNIIVFLHGFLGTSEDWVPIMSAMSASSRCIAIDLPGHGCSKMHTNADVAQGFDISMKVVTDMIQKLWLLLTNKKVTVVGYSMGARITLYMALKCNNTVKGVVMISGSPGLNEEVKRTVRCVKDDSLACALISYGLDLFIETWYSGDMWESLRSHPQFDKIVAGRSKHDDVAALAKALSGLSTGRQPSLWEDLKHAKSRFLLIVGERDEKFKKIAHGICGKLEKGKVVEICNCGHAVHMENPLLVIQSIREFVTSLEVLNS